MNRNYERPTVDAAWADSRNTHIAVATAIHAIASADRTPEQIWESPTQAESDHIKMAVQEYVMQGDFAADEENRYAWGDGHIAI